MYGTNQEITKEFILKNIPQEYIFEKYLNHQVILGKKYTNPLRVDKKAGCGYTVSNGRLLFVDYARKTSYDCFSLFANTSFYDTLLRIAIDFGLLNKVSNNSNVPSIELFKSKLDYKESKQTIIQVKRVAWNESNLAYWKQYGLNEEVLNRFKIAPISHYWINDRVFYCKNSYCYYFGIKDDIPRFKILNLNSDYKWFSNTPSTWWQGYYQLPKNGDILILTKSLKDIACLSLFDIPAVAVQSEHIMISDNMYEIIKNRFKIIYSLFDNDYTGKRLAVKYKLSRNIQPILMPNSKDFSDYIKNNGLEKTKNIYNEYRNKEK